MAKTLVDWLETEDGQYFVAACGYVPYMRGLELGE
jgi:ABC-type phosphate transport system substrate-binding protein